MEPLEISSKSSCAFPMIPRATLSDSQTSLRDRELPAETRDLGLFRRQPADLLAWVPARENAGIAEFAPLGHLGRVDALLPEIRAALVAEDRVFVAREKVEFLGRGECSPRFRASGPGAWAGVGHRPIVVQSRRG